MAMGTITRNELRNHEEYKKCVDKIESYSKGFEFTVPYYKMNQGQINMMHVVTDDMIKAKKLESIQFGLSLIGDITEETFRKL